MGLYLQRSSLHIPLLPFVDFSNQFLLCKCVLSQNVNLFRTVSLPTRILQCLYVSQSVNTDILKVKLNSQLHRSKCSGKCFSTLVPAVSTLTFQDWVPSGSLSTASSYKKCLIRSPQASTSQTPHSP